MRSVVAATDESDPAGRAVELAAQLAGKLGADLVLTHVISPSTVVSAAAGPPHLLRPPARVEAAAISDDATERANALLAQARRRAEEKGARHVRTEVRAGEPTEAILAVAKDHDAGIIVLGKRGQGRLTGLLLGSVSQKVVSLASCAVLVVP
jgi:nucleotide-binding universal stress UspA family protein